jgi:outer membrane receptor protein involved in Fe transport
MNFRNRRALIGAASISAVALLYAGTAIAQEAQTTPNASANEPEQTIIVTGSRIARPELDSPNPITAVTAQDIQKSGTTNLTDYLKTIPALTSSLSSFDNSGDRAPIGFTGLNLLDLRNLGFDRTLVLIDGRRQVASVDGLQAVDINTIPTDLIARVDVVTGGASAVYGADGVSGVVNFIQKQDFEGVTARFQNGISKYGDAGQRLIALTAGHNFSDGRGNIAVAWEHGEEDRLTVQDRSQLSGTNRIGFYNNPADTETGGENNDGIPDRIPYSNVRYFDTSRAGGIVTDFDPNELSTATNPFVRPNFFGANGAVYDPGIFLQPGYQQGGSGTLVSDYGNDLLPQIHRDIISGIGHFKFSDAFELYAEAKYAKTKSFSLAQPSFDYYLFIPEDNPYIPANVRPFINPANGGVLVNRDNFDLGQRGEDITRETIRTVIGARGEITSNLKYDISYVFGRTNITNHYIGDILTDRFYAAIDAVQGPNGITCRVNVDPSWTPFQPYNFTRSEIPPTTFSPGSCIPLNLFGEGVNSKAAVDWIKTDTTDRSKLTQHVVSGALTGNTGDFKLPGGPIAFAVGGEYRSESSSFVADPLAQQGLTFTNVLGNTKGNFHVAEAFGEVNVPILSDVEFAQRLEVGGAIRWSNYSTIGDTLAWKVDGTWAPVKDITFRGTYSTAVRAPNISELFSAQSQTFEFINDPCDVNYLQNGNQYRTGNCQTLLSGLGVANPSTYTDSRTTNIPGFQGGNPDLKEETAKTWTAGIVLQPSFIPHLVLTADWYNINIDDAINTADAQTIADLCVDQPTLDNQYCAAITRTNGGSTAGNITSFMVGPFNVANFHTAGLDVTLNYAYPTDTAGTFRLNLIGNYLNELTFVPIPGSPPVNQAYIGGSNIGSANGASPELQGTLNLGWEKGPFNFNWKIDYFSKTYRYPRQTIDSNPDIVAPQYLKLKELFENSVFASYDITDQFQIYGGIDNIFNEKPDIGQIGYPVSAVGTFFYLGAKVKLADIF